MTYQLSPDDREELYNAACEVFAASNKTPSDILTFRHALGRLGLSASVIEQEINERRVSAYRGSR